MEELEVKFQKMIEHLEIDVVDVEYVRDGGYNYLRVYIEKREGITTLDDCEIVSQIIGDEADASIKEPFRLEVSTPGIERSLKKEKDFLRFKGSKIELRTKNNIYERKIFKGILKGFENGKILIDEFEIPLEKLKKANLVYEFGNLNEKEEKK